MSLAIGRRRDILDLPDLAAESDHVGSIPDELKRRRLIQTVYNDSESPIRVNLHKRAGIRLRWSTLKGTIPEAL